MELIRSGSPNAKPIGECRPDARQSPTAFLDNLHLFVLTAFAVGQPVFDRVGERPAYLADMGIQPPAIILFTAVVSLFLPALLAGLVWGTGRIFPRARSPLFFVTVYILLTVAIAPIVNRAEFLPHWLSIGLALAGAAGATWAYFRSQRLRSVVTVAAPAVFIFPAMFLLTSPVARQYFFPGRKIETNRWNPVPVVVVVLDELCGLTLTSEQREIDAQRFPHFAELARSSTWFRNATTVYPDTLQAVPAILSGKYPSTHWSPTVADRPQNLFSILDATGAYESTIFEPISRLAPQTVESPASREAGTLTQMVSIIPAVGRVLLFDVTPGDLKARLPEVPRLWFGFHESANIDREQRRGVFRYARRDDRLGQCDHFLDCLDDSLQPQLYFLHVLLPHVPWCYLPSGRRCIADSDTWEILDEKLVADELFVEQCQQRHLLQVAFVDSQIGRLLDRLHETGLYDKCLLIVTADHGVSFKVGDLRRGVTEGNRADIMSVPLFIKAPGQQLGAISDKNVETVDILPTITDFLGIDLQLPVDGRSVFNTAPGARTDKRMHLNSTVGSAPISVPAGILNNSTVPQDLRRRFGPANDPDGLFRIGPHPKLVGQSVADVSTDSTPGAEIEMIRSGTDYRNDRAALVPCYFEGRIVVPTVTNEPVELALAVNGTVRATTRTYRYDGYRDRFAAMVPESAFQEGTNDVQWYAISGSTHELHLTPCIVRAPKPE